jgi:hypothetical protein
MSSDAYLQSCLFGLLLTQSRGYGKVAAPSSKPSHFCMRSVREPFEAGSAPPRIDMHTGLTASNLRLAGEQLSLSVPGLGAFLGFFVHVRTSKSWLLIDNSNSTLLTGSAKAQWLSLWLISPRNKIYRSFLGRVMPRYV